jgi:hypothetical protein
MAAKPHIQYRVPDDIHALLVELAEEAKARGVANASPNKMARILMQTALGNAPSVVAANEAMIQAFAMKQRIANGIGELLTQNLADLLEEASETS